MAVGDDEVLCGAAPKDTRDVADALLHDRFALIATQDLNVGDELTMDYNIGLEDFPYYDVLCKETGIAEPWL